MPLAHIGRGALFLCLFGFYPGRTCAILGHMNDIQPLLTKDDVCQILGVKESWLNAEIAAGNIPHLRLGKRKNIRFRPSHIEEYLNNKEEMAKEGSAGGPQEALEQS